MFQCEVCADNILRKKKGEVLIRQGGAVIRHVYLFFNCEIPQGGAKCADWESLVPLELLPSDLSGTGNTLIPSLLRWTAWY
eukprot:1069314-Karenia_brevis.AAC.1